MVSKTLDYARELIRRPSVTPEDEGSQDWMIEKLEALGFQCETLWFEEVRNLWARRGNHGPLFVFAGHTDVVATGEREEWTHDPFDPTIDGDLLYGRGAADMKGSIAAMLAAVEDFVAAHP